MLEHEQKNVWKMIGMRIRRERIKSITKIDTWRHIMCQLRRDFEAFAGTVRVTVD